MNRYTEKVDGIWSVSCKYEEPPYPVVTQEVIDRLAAIEDILGDKYDLERLRELAQADREGRCVVFQPGYDVVTIYNPPDEDGLYTMTVTGVISKEEYEAALKARE